MVGKLGQQAMPAGRTRIMGIVNVTPDSFSDGGRTPDAASALARALQLIDDGADIIDIGGESTRPGAAEVPIDEEIARTVPVIRELRARRPAARISIDTRKSAVAAAALAAGADIVNDVTGLSFSPEMAAVAARFGAEVVIGHTRGTPETMRKPENCIYADVVAEVIAFWRQAAMRAVAAGVDPEKIIYDPCFGFAKTAEQDWEMLRRIDAFRAVGPVLIGHSRKSFIGKFLNEPAAAKREAGTLAVSLYAAAHGAAVLRVHDVKATADALRVQQFLDRGR
jgi:dihydropteroate synthase